MLVKLVAAGGEPATEYDVFKGATMAMGKNDLLAALQGDRVLGSMLKSVDLAGCKATVAACASMDEPAPGVEAAGTPLKGAYTLQHIAGAVLPGTNLFVRVQLPSRPATADPHGASAGVSDVVKRFAEALAAARVTSLEHGCALLTLLPASDGKPTFWPGLQSPRLFIRPVFVNFYESPGLLNKFTLTDSGNWDDTLLRGVPGIGKSSFGLFVLWRLVMEGRSVVYEYPRGIDGGHELRFGSPPFAAYIADGTAPRYSSMPTLLISSPRGGGTTTDKAIIYDDFVKRPRVKHLYMPAPTADELDLLRTTCFPAVDAEIASEIAVRWGRRPRQVLAQQATERKELDTAIAETKLSSLAELARTMSERVAVNDVTFRIVDYVINDEYTDATFGWASPYIEQRVMARVMSASEHDRLSLLQDMLSTDGGLQLARPLFKDWCDIVMRQGSDGPGFRIRRLGVGSVDGKSVGVDEELLRKSDASLNVREEGGELARWSAAGLLDLCLCTHAAVALLVLVAAGGTVIAAPLPLFAAATMVTGTLSMLMRRPS